MAETVPGARADLGPVRGKARIDVLDILRGIAILGIFYMNVQFMGANPGRFMGDIRNLGWTLADKIAWAGTEVFWAGTQRGLFEFLFGAGALVLLAKAMKPTDPVAVADLFYRRNLLLIGFGLLDIFLVCWVGDILMIYGLAALLIFAFRKLSPKFLIPLGLMWTVASIIGVGGAPGVLGYQEQVEKIAAGQAALAKKESGAKLTEEEAETLEKWNERVASLESGTPSAKAKGMIKMIEKSQSSPADLMVTNWTVWQKVFGAEGTLHAVYEAVCGMFIGMALFKLGIIQGLRSARFYAGLAAISYAVGWSLRSWFVVEVMRFDPAQPLVSPIFYEIGRLAVTLGHVAFFNLLVKSAKAAVLLAPFKAAGRTAFSIYVLTSVVNIWIVFAPWGFNLFDRFSWWEFAAYATAFNAGMLILANVWLKSFASGPLEWAWRSLAYGKMQPFRRAPGTASAPAVPGTEINPPLPT